MNSLPAAQHLHAPPDCPPCAHLESPTTATSNSILKQACQFRLEFPAGGPHVFHDVRGRGSLWNRDHILLTNAPVQRNLRFALRGGLSNLAKNSLGIRCPDISEAHRQRAVRNNRDSALLAVLQQPSFNRSLN